MFKNFFKNESGQGMVEYALIIALVAVVLVTAFGLLKDGIEGKLTEATEVLEGEGE